MAKHRAPRRFGGVADGARISLPLLHRWGIRTLGAFCGTATGASGGAALAAGGKLWDRAGAARRDRCDWCVRRRFSRGDGTEHEVEPAGAAAGSSCVASSSNSPRASKPPPRRRDAGTAADLPRRRAVSARVPHSRADARRGHAFRVLSTHLESGLPKRRSSLSLERTPAPAEQAASQPLRERAARPRTNSSKRSHGSTLARNDRLGTPVAEDTHRPDALPPRNPAVR